ncbi:MAG TPA: type II secretion system protein, partial [Actinotalea sp.]|nr:type II secretion system protein [Actinotalea sp.]
MPRQPHPIARTGDHGVTLIEVVIAAVLVMILASTAVALILQTQDAQVDNRSRTAAASLAAREIDMVTEDFRRSRTAPVDIATAGVVVNPHPLAGGTVGEPLML